MWYDEFSNIGPDLAVAASPQPPRGLPALALGRGATATRWVDGLVATTATVLATYEDRHFRRWPAITTHTYGARRVTVMAPFRASILPSISFVGSMTFAQP